jgi:mannose-6-phosphate isomerase-like protein (cupin superfamily)
MASPADLDITASSIDELPQLWDGFAKMVRQGLGIRGFGVQIMDLPPDYTTRSHDETATGQEELYLALSGSGAVVIDGEPEQSVPLDPEHLARIGPAVPRRLRSGPDGMRVLCVGGVPGGVYEVPEWTESGTRD